MEKNGNVQLIMTEGILDKMVETAGKDKLGKWINEGNSALMKIGDDVKISLTRGKIHCPWDYFH
jgi:predicted transcriptional regulator